MYASSVNLLLADSGSAGTKLLEALIRFTKSPNPIFSFVGAQRELANRWVPERPHDALGEYIKLREGDFNEVYGPGAVAALATQLEVEPWEVVRLLNMTLFVGARLSSPDGERISDHAAQRLDADIRGELL